MKTEIFLIRHGEPVLKNALLGTTDSPLSELGWQQMEKCLRDIEGIEQIISSPLSRCASFAQQFASKCNLPLAIKPLWQECHFGDWDGKTYQLLYQQHPELVSQFLTAPGDYTPPNGEALKTFCERIENAINELLCEYQGKKIAVITHAGVIRTLVAWCLKMDYASGQQFKRFAIDYASMTHLSCFHGDEIFPQIITLNQKINCHHFTNDQLEKSEKIS